MLICGDGACLDEVLVDTHQSHNVAAGHVLNGLHIATHHQNCPGEKGGGGRGRGNGGGDKERENGEGKEREKGKLTVARRYRGQVGARERPLTSGLA